LEEILKTARQREFSQPVIAPAALGPEN
jgi:hypothetical protein